MSANPALRISLDGERYRYRARIALDVQGRTWSPPIASSTSRDALLAWAHWGAMHFRVVITDRDARPS